MTDFEFKLFPGFQGPIRTLGIDSDRLENLMNVDPCSTPATVLYSTSHLIHQWSSTNLQREAQQTKLLQFKQLFCSWIWNLTKFWSNEVPVFCSLIVTISRTCKVAKKSKGHEFHRWGEGHVSPAVTYIILVLKKRTLWTNVWTKMNL